MISSFFNRLIEGFNFSIKDFLILIVISIFLIGGYKAYQLIENTNNKINAMEKRYIEDIYENGFTVMSSLQRNHIKEPEEIINFLSSKPAGKSDLKKSIKNDTIYKRLVSDFDILAKNCKKALM